MGELVNSTIFHKYRRLEQIPYPIIALVTRMPQTLQGLNPLAVRCRNFENFTLSFSLEQDALDVFESIKELTVVSTCWLLFHRLLVSVLIHYAIIKLLLCNYTRLIMSPVLHFPQTMAGRCIHLLKNSPGWA